MKTAADRDDLVARVQEVFSKHPTFESWPMAKERGDFFEVIEPSGDEQSYVALLYKVCALGMPTGRTDVGLTGYRPA